MKYQVVNSFRVKTSQEEMELKPGQVVTLPHEAAIRLLNEGRIKPIERVAYKVYSEVLGEDLWIVDTDADMHSLRDQGKTDVIYTFDECYRLKGLDKSSLRELHAVKKNFDKAVIREVKRKS